MKSNKPNIREELLNAGLVALHQHGYNATGVQDITKAAGVPKGSFYYYFESKEAMGAEAVDRYGTGSGRRLVLADQSIAPRERLRRYFSDLNDMFSGKEFIHGCLLGNLSAEVGDSSPVIRERLNAVYGLWTHDIAGAIRDGQQDGSISNTFPPEQLATFLLDAWEGAVLRARVAKDRSALDIFLNVGLATALA